MAGSIRDIGYAGSQRRRRTWARANYGLNIRIPGIKFFKVDEL